MLTQTRQTSEVSIAAPVVAWLKREGYTLREELVFTHPTQGQVSIDAAGVRAGENGDETIIVEAKRSLNDALVEQCERWIGLANQIMAVVPPFKKWTLGRQSRRTRLGGSGIMLFVSDPMGNPTVRCLSRNSESFNHNANSAGIIDAILRTPDTGPPAGTQTGQRMTDSRREWKAEIEYLRECMGEGVAFSEIKRYTRTRKTAAALRRAVDEGGLPIRYDNGTISRFRYAEQER